MINNDITKWVMNNEMNNDNKLTHIRGRRKVSVSWMMSWVFVGMETDYGDSQTYLNWDMFNGIFQLLTWISSKCTAAAHFRALLLCPTYSCRSSKNIRFYMCMWECMYLKYTHVCTCLLKCAERTHEPICFHHPLILKVYSNVLKRSLRGSEG